MDPERRPTRSTRLAPLAQACLAALVAGSLLTFSALAFNTAFDSGTPTEVTAAAPKTAAPRPVLLPGTPPSPTRSVTTATEDRAVRVIEATARGNVVLGARVPRAEPAPAETSTPRSPEPRRSLRSEPVVTGSEDTHEDSHRHGNGNGHIKARGKGHHKGFDKHERNGDDSEAREDDDDAWDEDDDYEERDDDDSNDGSHEGSGGHGHGHSKDDK